MENDWFITAIVLAIVLLVYFLIKLNIKDRKKIEEELNFLQESEDIETNNDLTL
jgi:preprotein translocase subunit YajC